MNQIKLRTYFEIAKNTILTSLGVFFVLLFLVNVKNNFRLKHELIIEQQKNKLLQKRVNQLTTDLQTLNFMLEQIKYRANKSTILYYKAKHALDSCVQDNRLMKKQMKQLQRSINLLNYQIRKADEILNSLPSTNKISVERRPGVSVHKTK